MRRDSLVPRNVFKGRIRFETRDGRKIVIKDYNDNGNSLARAYGKWTLRNEARAYARLAGIAGIPSCKGLDPDGCLEMEFMAGRHLGLFKRRSVPATVFDNFARVLQAMHDRGVANMDLHRSNVLVADDGTVSIIDFAHSVIARDPSAPGMLVRLAMLLDRYAFARMQARYLGLEKPKPRGLFGMLYVSLRAVRRVVRKIKRGLA